MRDVFGGANLPGRFLSQHMRRRRKVGNPAKQMSLGSFELEP
jgi:hypothetical protein